MSRSLLEITNECPYADYEDIADNHNNTPLNLRTKLPIIRIIGICSSVICIQIAYAILFSFQTPIMKKHGMSNIIISILTISGPLCSCIIQPIIESACINCRSKIGRNRPFILCGGLGIIISFIMIYFSYHFGGLFFKIIITISIFILNFSIQILQKPSLNIIEDLVPEGQQPIANFITSLMVNISAAITGLTSFLLCRFFSERSVLLFAITAVFVCATITLLTGKEEQQQESRNYNFANPFTSILSCCKSISIPVLRICFVYFLCWFSFYPFVLECSYFYGINGENEYLYERSVSYGMLTFMNMNLIVMIYKPFEEKINRKFGMRNVLVVSQIIEGFLMIFILFCSSNDRNKIGFLFLFAPLGISACIFNTIPFAICEKCVNKEDFKNYLHLMNFFGSAGQQLSSLLLFGLFGLLNDRQGLIIGFGFLSAFASAVLCAFIVSPDAESTVMEPLAPSSDYYDN